MRTVTIREYARLTTDEVSEPGLDRAQLSVADFDELCMLNEKRREGVPPLLRLTDRQTLSVCHYVGIIQTSLGTRIEILPKTGEDASPESVEHERRLLVHMLETVLNPACREGKTASIRRFRAPLQEWVIRRFLEELHMLVKKGLRFSYHHVAEEKPFLRGRLDTSKQAVQPPQKMHLVHIRHNVFSLNRPEHRLLRCALERCAAVTREMENIRLITPLRSLFSDIPQSVSPANDFRQWNASRNMAHYQSVRPWCELVLGKEMPFALAGEWHGISMLFPMEKLFEKYIGVCLRRRLVAADAQLYEQVSGRWLCILERRRFFSLRPDFLIRKEGKDFLLDAKWKKLSSNSADNYGISQQDIYQLFAYGHKYMSGIGELALIYPVHKRFPSITKPFIFSEGLRLWVLGFDLEYGKLLSPSLQCPIMQLFSGE